jgi:cell division protein FtsQ
VSAGYFFWLRDSSLVAVNRLSVSGVSGVSGADSTRIKAALAEAARDMTTLHIRHDDLARAVRPFPIVKSVSASPSYPNTLSVEVELLKPALVVEAPGRTVTVADDGTMLRGVAPVRGLPRLHVSRAPAGTRLSGEALEQALVLGAMPTQLRPYVLGASMLASGVEVRMKNGPEIRFGDGTGARVKWAAATRVLADKRVGSVAYVDVSAPERPAVGGIMQGIVGESAPVAPSSTVVPSQ